jgi:protein SCO1/2
MTMRRIFAAAALVSMAASAAAQPGAPRPVNPASALPAPLAEIGIDQKLGDQIPLDLVFRDEAGREVRLADYFGAKPVLLSLAYYECPMLCTQVLNGLAHALRPLSFTPGREFTILTVSFNPRETPELAAAKKRTYLEDYGRREAADGWHFLTGDEASIRRLTNAVGFRYAWDERTQQYVHATGVMIVTPEGKLARYFYGIEYSTRDLRLGLVEAAERRIGSPVDQLLLACFHYDPARGAYSLMTLNLVRVGGVLTILALGTFIVASIQRDRRRHSSVRVGPHPHAQAPPSDDPRSSAPGESPRG